MKFIKKIPSFVWLFLGANATLWVGCFVMSFVANTWAAPAMFMTLVLFFALLFVGSLASFTMWWDNR